MWGSKHRVPSVGLLGCRESLGPLLIMISCPIITLLLVSVLNGLLEDLPGKTILRGIRCCSLLKTTKFGFFKMIISLCSFMSLNILCLKFLPPVKLIFGPITPGGLYPEYVDNGIQSLMLNLLSFVLFSNLGYLHLYDIDILVRHLPELLVLTNAFSFAFCVWLYRHNQANKTLDHSTSGKVITDFYVGNELHPNFLSGIDVKQFTNCRFGMMLWPLMVVSAAGCELGRHGSISYASGVAYFLQIAYLVKFFLWEKGYFFTLDMMHDRAGFYLCWGCINWVPSVYALVSIFHGVVRHESDMSQMTMVSLISVGLLFLFLNYHADLQRKQFREAGKGKFFILGNIASYIIAKYRTEDGKDRSSRLLTSGYWGTSRHFNYFSELVFSYVIGATTAFVGLGPYGLIFGMFYPVFLTILLVDRCYRDEAKCLSKYGASWKRYCKKVPYRLIPGIY